MHLHLPLIITFAASAFLAGCKEEAENHTVEYFIANPAERAAMLETCEVVDRAMDDANCVNAREAAQKTQTQQDREGSDRLFGDPSFN
ncbi:hypothetical protein PhaeoP23_03751 (plasmid) [Phaeobacter piscinae]|uniref:EexN family lipoprotein n=1 Tax=Phaeobacter piscinae TaxID=1580596 RepID=A0ABM6PJ63_9RHOB|nr:EexN family lipoprotein [Phaeobacter piscinae]ATG37828.1 hypothetical protein PhaeoP36_03751 [Phaeobacter piscinae]AUQ88349.1 hypothetical protein PhaeoP42_03752 [Phaeobacter piscinae]AUR26232.1 hypothetical protein PhaeoP23_03751 [Phaeobacter piscinae]